jgi:hypothetical protein
MRNYGRIVQDMIGYACTVENQAERESLEVYIAQCMRQRNMVWNRDQESGIGRVKEDILFLSKGALKCDSEAFNQLLAQNGGTQTPNNGSKKKKNK